MTLDAEVITVDMLEFRGIGFSSELVTATGHVAEQAGAGSTVMDILEAESSTISNTVTVQIFRGNLIIDA